MPDVRFVQTRPTIEGPEIGRMIHPPLSFRARAAGIPDAVTLVDGAGLEAFGYKLHAAQGSIVAVVKVAQENAGMVLAPRDGVHLRQRFRRCLLGDEAG